VPSNGWFVFVGGPWDTLAAPPSSTGVWQAGGRLWVVRMHDDPLDFKPVFVESYERPYVNAPAVTLGYYACGDCGWTWVETLSRHR
jgi:hypothetical protein